MILDELDYIKPKLEMSEIEQMIWEVDENLDGRIDEYEFRLMYKRCVNDQTGLEPRNLYNLVQFLMYLKCDTNASSGSGNNTTSNND